ncbi:MAG: hypothetical protein U9O18_04390 [Chloroflexota bacterium]|nr:hypothetical protein [Chloroflexota bacterium]
MRTAGMLSITLLLATSVGPVAAAEETVDASDLVRAVENTLAAETAHIGVQVMMEAPGVGIDPTLFMDVTGQIAFDDELRFRLDGEMLDLGSFSFIADGGDMYLSGELVDGLLSPGDWLYVDASAPPPGFEDLQSSFEVGGDVALALYWLLGVDGPIEVLDAEPVGEGEATHVEVPIDLELVRDQLPRWLLPAYEQNLAGLREAGADVDRAEAWLGEDDFVQRLSYDMPVSLGDQLALLTVGYDFSGFGEPLELGLPDPADIVDAWELIAEE